MIDILEARLAVEEDDDNRVLEEERRQEALQRLQPKVEKGRGKRTEPKENGKVNNTRGNAKFKARVEDIDTGCGEVDDGAHVKDEFDVSGGREESGDNGGDQKKVPHEGRGNPLNEMVERLSNRGRIIYLCTRGDHYLSLTLERLKREQQILEEEMALVTLANSVDVKGKVKNLQIEQAKATTEEFKLRVYQSYSQAHSLAKTCLDSFDPMRLLTVHALCKYYVELGDNPKLAAELASVSFYEANHHHFTEKEDLSERILQKLRDEYMANTVLKDDDEGDGEGSKQDEMGVDEHGAPIDDANDADKMAEVNGFDPTFTIQLSAFALRFAERIRKQVYIFSRI